MVDVLNYYTKAKELKKRVSPKEEKVIATCPMYAFFYARDVIQGRWPEAEETIKSSYYSWWFYKKHFQQEIVVEEILNS